MLPVKRRRTASFQRQRPLLHTHCVQNGVIAGKSGLNGDWTNLPSLVLVQVLLHISSPKDRRSVSLACRSWNQCMNDHRLWRTVRVHLPTVCTLHSRQWSLLSLRHTSRVSLGSLSPSTLPRILRKMVHHLPALLFLGLELRKTGKKPTSYDLNILSDFSNLEELTIQGCQISIHFSSLPALKRLVIQNRVEAKFSVELPNLEALSMVLEQNDTLKMEYFKSVRLLCLTRSVLSCRSFAADEPHTGTFPSTDKPHTGTFPTADEPHAGTFPSTDDPHTGTFPSVEHLDISYSQLSWGTKIFFTRFPSLFFLSVAHCDLSERDLLIMVEVLTQLRELILTGNNTTDAVIAAITAPLKSLILQRSTKVTSRGLKELARHCRHSLTSLDLSHSPGITPHTLIEELQTWFPLMNDLRL